MVRQELAGDEMSGPAAAEPFPMSMSFEDPLLKGTFQPDSFLSRSPAKFTPGSYEVSHMKRARAGSISGRLRSASDLEERGLIDKAQKGVLKDLIISGDAALQSALDNYEGGDASQLASLMQRGLLNRRDSLDLLQDLDMSVLSMDLGGGLGSGLDAASFFKDNPGTASPTRSLPGSQAQSWALSEAQSWNLLESATTAANAAASATAGDTMASAPAADPACGASIGFDRDAATEAAAAGGGSAGGGGGSGVFSGALGSIGGSLSSALGALDDDDLGFGLGSMSFGGAFDMDFGGRGAAADAPARTASMAEESAADAAMRITAPQATIAATSTYHEQEHTAPQQQQPQQRPLRRSARAAKPTPVVTPDLTPQLPGEVSDADDSCSDSASSGGGGGGGARTGGGAYSPQFHFSFSDDAVIAAMREELRSLGVPTHDTPTSDSPTGFGAARGDAAEPPMRARARLRSGTAATRVPAATAAAAAAAAEEEQGPRMVGAYSPGSRQRRVERFLEKRKHRVWVKTVKYDVRKSFADTRMRVKGRFVKKDDEALLREVMALC